MQPYPGRQRWWAGCVLASLLLHLCCLWSVERWLAQTSSEERIALQLEPPALHPFTLKQRLALSPGKHPFAPRPPFRPAPRQPSDLVPGAGRDYLERGMAAGLESQATSTPFGDYSNADTLVAHRDWEHTALQAWRDSVAEFLTRREPDKEDHILDALAAALEAGRTMVELDPETGEFVRAHWYLPVYGGGCTGHSEGWCNDYMKGLAALEERLKKLTQGIDLPRKKEEPFPKTTGATWETVPLFSSLMPYPLAAPDAPPVPFDPIHRFGMLSHRQVLDSTELMKYPVVLLQWIDPKDSAELARYLLLGGYVLADHRQLDAISAALSAQLTEALSPSELDRQTLAEIARLGIGADDPRYQEYYQRLHEAQVLKAVDARLRRVPIWSGHPLLKAYYAIDHLYPTGHDAHPPLQGLEVDGRLVAVAECRAFREPLKIMLFANEVIYGLIQPSELGGRYTSR